MEERQLKFFPAAIGILLRCLSANTDNGQSDQNNLTPMDIEYLRQNPEKLIRTNGRMIGISFARRKGTGHALKVEINKKTTMYGLSPHSDFDKQWEKAVDFVLTALSIDVKPELKDKLMKTRFKF